LTTPFTICGRYRFDFTSSGLFTLVDKEGEPLYERALPFFEKAMSHLVWIFFWMSLILASHFFLPLSWLKTTDRLLMALIFFHLFFFGCRLTTLLLFGGLMPILFPPLWIRLTRKLQKGAGFELLTKHALHTHPGLLTNLALVQYTHGESQAACQTLRRALSYAPDHPLLLELIKVCAERS
jgi:hypothetical protein